MILKNYYYWFENVVSDHMCEKIIQYGNSLRDEVAATGDQASQNMPPEAISKLKKEIRFCIFEIEIYNKLFSNLLILSAFVKIFGSLYCLPS